jgi:hypothetical protein
MDIDIPPGTPVEVISNFQPAITVTKEMRIIETGLEASDQSGNAAGGKQGKKVGTDVQKKVVLPPKAPPPVSAGFFEATGITTIDFPGHYPWAGQLTADKDPIAEDLTITSYTNGEKVKALKPKFVPYFSVKNSKYEAYLKCFQRILIKYFHHNRTLDNEDIYYLLLFGDPAASFAVSIRDIKEAMREFCDKVLNYLDPETKQPEVPALAS